MRYIILIVSLMAASLPARASDSFQFRFSGRDTEIDKARTAMDKWLTKEAKKEFPAKIKTLTKNRMIELARQDKADLRDAVSAAPEMQPARPAANVPCTSLEFCPARTASARAEDVSGLPDAVATLVQPWLVLQQRRGGAISLSAGDEDPEVLATMGLDGLVSSPVEIRVSPGPSGGFQLWLRSPADLDDVYDFSREAILHPSEPR